ncbi:MAG TPA: hypothetical protein DHV62_01950 [Elusimicrobia bacterium]|jgi:thiamine biosynthesis lipoprotein|nr:hypothetical protein [Elusimicrobiota bacterium]
MATARVAFFMKMKRFLLSTLYSLLFALLIGCAQEQVYKKERKLMGTTAEITLYGENNQTAVEQAFKAMEEIEKIASEYRKDSQLSKINRYAGTKKVKVDPRLYEMIEKSVYYSKLSDGAFDITVGPLIQLWRIKEKMQKSNSTLPSEKEIKQKLKLVSYQEISLNRKEKSVYLKKKGMKIGLGAVAKGYAVDEAVKSLKVKGVKTALVRLGGEIRVLGERKKPWKIGIQHPREKDGILGVVELRDGEAVSTSGDYEQYFLKNDVRYHHIFNPKTGKPAWECQAVTIVASKGIDADIFSTTVFVLGPDKGMELIEKLPDIEGLIVKNDGEVIFSSGMEFSQN